MVVSVTRVMSYRQEGNNSAHLTGLLITKPYTDEHLSVAALTFSTLGEIERVESSKNH